jgi:hypothetical protein
MANIPDSLRAHDYYFPLDNGAVFMASVTGRSAPFIFRISCDLDEPVYLPDLEAALVSVADRFPFFKTVLRRGVFWFYLDPLKRPVRVFADTRYPVEYHRLGSMHRYLFRVRAYDSRISCEFHHILTDGTGAVEFVRALVACYLTRRGVSCLDWGTIKKPTDPVDPEELVDAYANLVGKTLPVPGKLPAAWHLPGKRLHGIPYRVTTGTMPVSVALEKARGSGVSLTVFLSAIYLAALQDVFEATPPRTAKPISVQIPVNMRRFHPTASLRNFFLCVSVSIDPRLGHYDFREILDRVSHEFALNLTVKELNRQIRRNVMGEEMLFSRLIPLVVKDPVLKIVGAFVDGPVSGNISNLQSVNLPPEFAAHVRRFDFLPGRKAAVGANIGVVSFGDCLSVTIGSLVREPALERAFFTRCVALGIPVTVDSNMQSK